MAKTLRAFFEDRLIAENNPSQLEEYMESSVSDGLVTALSLFAPFEEEEKFPFALAKEYSLWSHTKTQSEKNSENGKPTLEHMLPSSNPTIVTFNTDSKHPFAIREKIAEYYGRSINVSEFSTTAPGVLVFTLGETPVTLLPPSTEGSKKAFLNGGEATTEFYSKAIYSSYLGKSFAATRLKTELVFHFDSSNNNQSNNLLAHKQYLRELQNIFYLTNESVDIREASKSKKKPYKSAKQYILDKLIFASDHYARNDLGENGNADFIGRLLDLSDQCVSQKIGPSWYPNDPVFNFSKLDVDSYRKQLDKHQKNARKK